MKNVADGYAEINARGRSYELTPSFLNISKIGSPQEIIQKFHSVMGTGTSYIDQFCDAIFILECCGVEELSLTGGLTFSEWSNKTMIMPGDIEPNNVILLARHCMQHGICGSLDQIQEAKDEGEAKPLVEFDAYKHVVTAVETLGLSYDEAWNLTMTSFAKLMAGKYNNMVARGEIEPKIGKKAQLSILERHKEIVAKRDAARGKKQ